MKRRSPLAEAASPRQFDLLCLAVQFLSRWPVRRAVPWTPTAMTASTRYFPLVGALIGAVGALVLWLAQAGWPTPLAVLLSMASTVWLTGALHEDGLADTFDGLGGSAARPQALAIMKDSRLGTYGALALGLVLALKALALMSWPWSGAPWLVIWMHAASRFAPLVLMIALPYAGDVQQAKVPTMSSPLPADNLPVATLTLVILALALGLLGLPGMVLLVGALSVVAVTVVCGRWFGRRLGGYTGDCLGATQQLAEVLGYLAAIAWMGRGAL